MLTDEDRVRFETLNDSFYCLSCSCERQCSDPVNSSILSLDLRNPLETDPISGVENTHIDYGQPLAEKTLSEETGLKQVLHTDVIQPHTDGSGLEQTTPKQVSPLESHITVSETIPIQSPLILNYSGGSANPEHHTLANCTSKATKPGQNVDAGRPSHTETSDTSSPSGLGGNLASKAPQKPVRQPNKKGDKQKLKYSEQEEQLKLARSMISNMERKINDLENSNRILRRDALLGNHKKVGDEVNDSTTQEGSALRSLMPDMPPHSHLEQELRFFRENLRNVELEQLKMKFQNTEMLLLQCQKQLSNLPTSGSLTQPQSNPSVPQSQPNLSFPCGAAQPNPSFPNSLAQPQLFPGHPSSLAQSQPSTSFPSSLVQSQPNPSFFSSLSQSHPNPSFPSSSVQSQPKPSFPSNLAQSQPNDNLSFSSSLAQSHPNPNFPSSLAQSQPNPSFPSSIAQSQPSTSFPGSLAQSQPSTSFPSSLVPPQPNPGFPSSLTHSQPNPSLIEMNQPGYFPPQVAPPHYWVPHPYAAYHTQQFHPAWRPSYSVTENYPWMRQEHPPPPYYLPQSLGLNSVGHPLSQCVIVQGVNGVNVHQGIGSLQGQNFQYVNGHRAAPIIQAIPINPILQGRHNRNLNLIPRTQAMGNQVDHSRVQLNQQANTNKLSSEAQPLQPTDPVSRAAQGGPIIHQLALQTPHSSVVSDRQAPREPMLEPMVEQTPSRVNATEPDSTHQQIQAVMVSAEPAIQRNDADDASIIIVEDHDVGSKVKTAVPSFPAFCEGKSERDQKPFLASGRASEKTGKRRSL